MLSPTLDTIRIFLHVLSASVWVGGQIVMAGLLGTAKGLDPDAPRALARAFGRVAWPAYGLAVITGMWGLLEVSSAPFSYHLTLGLKIVLVAAAGFSAAVHSQTSKAALKATTGASGGLLVLTILFLGVLLETGQ